MKDEAMDSKLEIALKNFDEYLSKLSESEIEEQLKKYDTSKYGGITFAFHKKFRRSRKSNR